MTILKDYTIASERKVSSGKVREIYTLGEGHLLLVTTDRISAFDVVLSDLIPHKGEVLNRLSLWWFDKTSPMVKNHVVSSDIHDYPPPFCGDKRLDGRSMLVVRATPLPIECIVRGYISGSGWKEYQHNGSICGIMLPAGLRESEKLPKPIFTPTTKAPVGQHDENITMEHAADLIGWEVLEQVREISVKIYTMAMEEARNNGIIIADTKFEFGILDGEIILIDEVLTPDSSRFWPMDGYAPGKPQPSFDKQFVRDYLETLDWDKTNPGPELPTDIIARTSEKYIDAYEKITGIRFPRGRI